MRSICKLVFPSQGFVLVLAESVVWKDLHSLEHSVVLEMFSESSDVLFEIAYSRNKHVPEPERLTVIFEPLGCLQGLLVAASCQSLVSCVVELLAVKEYKICLSEEFLDVAVPGASVGVDADIDAFFL